MENDDCKLLNIEQFIISIIEYARDFTNHTAGVIGEFEILMNVVISLFTVYHLKKMVNKK